jgi:hypothetical protein
MELFVESLGFGLFFTATLFALNYKKPKKLGFL